MANVDDPRGFRLYQKEGKTVRTRDYAKSAATEIFEGSLLKRVAGGTVEPAAAGDSATLPIVGVAAHYSAAADTDPIAVIDDPEATFIAQATGTYADADNGLNADISVGTAGGPDSRRSGSEIDMGTKAATATLPFKIIERAPQINSADNDPGTETDLLVKLNQSERGAGTTGI